MRRFAQTKRIMSLCLFSYLIEALSVSHTLDSSPGVGAFRFAQTNRSKFFAKLSTKESGGFFAYFISLKESKSLKESREFKPEG